MLISLWHKLESMRRVLEGTKNLKIITRLKKLVERSNFTYRTIFYALSSGVGPIYITFI
jgi:hypothetical protein